MVESILSIPFYMVRIPFRIALPLATAIFSILPISIAILLTHKEEVSWGCFLSFLFVSYPIDILLNVPRNLASGICITTIACIYLIKSNHTMQLIFSSFFAVLGIIITNSAIVVLAVTGFYLLYKYHNYKRILIYAIGAVPAICYWAFINFFYKANPQYLLASSWPFNWDVKQIFTNMNQIWDTAGNLNFLQIPAISVLICLCFMSLLIITKNWIGLMCCFISIICSISFFGLSKINDFSTGILFSQLRMLLFLPYLISLLLFICDDIQTHNKQNSQFDTTNVLQKFIKPLRCTMFTLSIISCLFKLNQIISETRYGNELTSTGVISVTDTFKTAQTNMNILEAAADQKCEWIITVSDSRAQSYALGAMGYGKFHFYNAVYDRRTWEWEDANDVKEDTRCLLVWYHDDTFTSETVELRNISIVSFLEEQYSLTRK